MPTYSPDLNLIEHKWTQAKSKKRERLRHRYFVLTPHGVIKIKSLSYSMGDKALTAVAIRDAVRSRDVVVRYGGEEFLVLLIDVDETEALTMDENVRQAVLNLKIPHLYKQEASTTVTLSVGIASLTGANIDASLTVADQAKYQGRNAVKFAGLPVGEKSPSSAER